MAKSQVKYGALFSYALIILNTLHGLFLTPFIVENVGQSQYGVYKTIAAFTVSLIVLDMGMGGTLMRYIARFRTDNEEEKIPNFIAMILVQAAIIIGIVSVLIVIAFLSIEKIYSAGLTAPEIEKAKQLMIFLGINVCLSILERAINGIITGYNRFLFANGFQLIRLLARFVLLFVLIFLTKDVLVLVLVDIFLSVVALIVEAIYIRKNLNIKVKLTAWDNALFKETFKYTFLLFLTTIAAMVNGNLDNVIIGAIEGSVAVTIYSYGLLIFGMFEQLSTSISGVMLPTVTKTLANDDENSTATQSLIVKAGRIQFILLGAAIAGFAIVGNRFINIWLGDGYSDVYIITLILMVPALFELCVNVCLSVLRAKNILAFRTYILIASTALNAIITIVGTYLFNYFAAAIGTAASFLIGSVIIMNIYYYKKLGFNMLNIYKRIFKKIWVCILLSSIIAILVAKLFTSGFIGFALPAIAFVIVYAISLWIYGLDKEDKDLLIKRGVKNG